MTQISLGSTFNLSQFQTQLVLNSASHLLNDAYFIGFHSQPAKLGRDVERTLQTKGENKNRLSILTLNLLLLLAVESNPELGVSQFGFMKLQ